jgi:hypothetical protein
MTIRESLKNYFTTIGMADGQVASLFNEDGTEFKPEFSTTLLQHDATRIGKVKTDSKTEGFNQGHQKGLSEGANKIEDLVKEKYGISSDKKGIDLVDEIITEKSKPQKLELEEDKVKAHPAFIKMRDEYEKKIKETDTTWKKKYEDRDESIAKEQMFKSVLDKAKAQVTTLKPILPKDPAKAEKQMELLILELAKHEYKADADNKGLIILKEGKPLDDAHGNRIHFDQLVKNIATGIWDFEEGQQRSGAGNNNDGTGAGKKNLNVKVPKNDQEYMEAIANEKDPEVRIAIDNAYAESTKG